MYVNWAHYWIPKCSFILSFIFNPIFIYLLRHDNNILVGNYRYLLYFFAVFNMIASIADILAPVCVHGYRYATVTFLVDGPFSSRSQFGEDIIAYRCAFISGTYGILIVHFIFRYMLLKRNHFINQYFLPYGLVLSIVFVLFHMFIWVVIVKETMYSVPEMREYAKISFRNVFNESLDEINFVAGVFSEVSNDIIRRSWIGIGSLTVIAFYSMTIYFVLGYKIVTGIRNSIATMSNRTSFMQKKLFKALVVQTVIPLCVSFLPCNCAFYGAGLRIDFVNWVYWVATVAISMFPFLDPMAIILFLPVLRRRLTFCFTHSTMISSKPPSHVTGNYYRETAVN